MIKDDKFKSIEGFKSIYPKQWGKWLYVRKTVEEIAEEFGFKQISTPSVERESLYHVKPPWCQGMLEETFRFQDNEDRELTLIPEQTPTRSRMIQEKEEVDLPIRWYGTSKRWRQEKEVKPDRAKEFWQTDLDIIGCNTVKADAEIIACAAEMFKKLGLKDEVKILVSHRGLFENILNRAGVSEEYSYDAVKIIDDVDKISEKEFRERFSELGLTDEQIDFIHSAIDIKGSIRKKTNELKEKYPKVVANSEDILNRILDLCDLLEDYGVYKDCILDLSIARGSFYTGIIFEVFDRNKDLGALAGGGRYNWLVGMYGDRDLTAIGFGFGHLGVVEKLKQSGLFEKSLTEKSIFVSCKREKDYKSLIELAGALREKGYQVEKDIGVTPKLENYKAFIEIQSSSSEVKSMKLKNTNTERELEVENFSRVAQEVKKFLN